MRRDQNYERDPVTPGRTVKPFKMVVEIFEAQLSLLRINLRAQRRKPSRN